MIMRTITIVLPVIVVFGFLLSACDEETHQRILFSNCINGKDSPEYAEAVKACADAAIRIRDSQKK